MAKRGDFMIYLRPIFVGLAVCGLGRLCVSDIAAQILRGADAVVVVCLALLLASLG